MSCPQDVKLLVFLFCLFFCVIFLRLDARVGPLLRSPRPPVRLMLPLAFFQLTEELWFGNDWDYFNLGKCQPLSASMIYSHINQIKSFYGHQICLVGRQNLECTITYKRREERERPRLIIRHESGPIVGGVARVTPVSWGDSAAAEAASLGCLYNSPFLKWLEGTLDTRTLYVNKQGAFQICAATFPPSNGSGTYRVFSF